MQILIRLPLYEQTDLDLHHLIRPFYLINYLKFYSIYVYTFQYKVPEDAHCLINIDSTLDQRYGVESTLIQSCFNGVYHCVKVTKKNKNIKQHTTFQGVSFLGFLQSLISFRIFLPSHCHLSGSFCRLLLSLWSFCRLFSIILRLFAIFPANVSLLFRVFLPFSGTFCCLFGSFCHLYNIVPDLFFASLHLSGSFCRLIPIFLDLFAVFLQSYKYRFRSFCHLLGLLNIAPGLFVISLPSFRVFLLSFCYLSGPFCRPFSIVLGPIFLGLLVISLLSFRVLAVFFLSF